VANKNKKQILRNLFDKHIKRTQEEAIIFEESVLLCHLTKIVKQFLLGIDKIDSKVYINTKVLKHLYDKKPAEEFDFIVDNLYKIIKYPDNIYKNKDNKRGSFCFIKNIKKEKYFCSIQIEENKKELFVVTAFRIRKEAYIKNYELLWSWKGDIPSS